MKCEWVNNHESSAYQDYNLIMESKYMKIIFLLTEEGSPKIYRNSKELKLWNNDTSLSVLRGFLIQLWVYVASPDD